ncbi:MAG: HAD family phosphatase [Chloroflexi bacterium]|jgi:HAD superfamily hydrolase (TIGR01509 family)|nr:HAD family phosphatase [Chloroflexota bacterium]MBT4073840.1 HAD family phosphatase [Chloroflexota bacterium]MBT5318746.1 HAD family phosphatase [Chloroflexota bacterium]MBT6680988.1 HAD family phosphatase [Chloroflexota bacterium]
MGRITHVIFDLGQVLTLVDETVAVRAMSARTDWSDADINTAMFSPERKRPIETGSQTWNEFTEMIRAELDLDMDADEFTETFLTVLTPNEPMFDLVRALAPRFKLGCCSNTSSPHWDEIRRSVPVTDLFGPRILSFEVGSMKPDKRIYRDLIKACAVDAEQIVFIDDNQPNVESAAATGIKALLFTSVSKLESDLHDLGIDWE